ncbi:MAG: peptidylprolyl isomerase [Nevskiaceae bacterium]|nr:MAG: peptidylprolyl isomerase [Nevskiaceae bacterium]TBR71640.1 MAG: peptidylprolyl isomerase [Nevskiaceae bacterium]
MQIADRRVASFHYTLTDDDGKTLDSSRGHEPLSYLHGGGNIVSGLERALVGKVAGETLKVDVSPEDGYGLHREQLVQVVPASAFGDTEVKPGMRFTAETDGGPVSVVVTQVADGQVTVDGNHPLAGQTLHFDVEVVDVREASPEEIVHGHVHGPHDHHH